MSATPVSAHWRNGIELLSVAGLPTQLTAGVPITVRVRWQSATPMTEAFTAFVHLQGPDGAILAQDDHAPRQGFWPTTGWRPGVAVDDDFTLTVPATLAPGEYHLLIGWYNPANGERVLLDDGRTALELMHWTAP
jgi:hypothetical protein